MKTYADDYGVVTVVATDIKGVDFHVVFPYEFAFLMCHGFYLFKSNNANNQMICNFKLQENRVGAFPTHKSYNHSYFCDD